MKIETWDSIETFLDENTLEFTHVDSDEDFNKAIDESIDEKSSVVADLDASESGKELKCRRRRPVRRRTCRWKTYRNRDGSLRRQYECVTTTVYECVER